MIKRIRSIRILGLGLILFSTIAQAQDNSQFVLDRPGKWSTAYLGDATLFKITSLQKETYKQTLARIAETLRNNSRLLSNPKGFDLVAELWFDQQFEWDKHDYNYGVTGTVDLTFRIYRKQKGVIERYNIEPPHLAVRINNTQAATGGGFVYNPINASDALLTAAKKLNELFSKINIEKEIAPGVTLYQNGSLVVANPNRPPYWVPVTVGEVFDLLLAYHRLEVKQDPGAKPLLDAVTEVYQRYSKAQLDMPAYRVGLSGENITGITWDKAAEGFPVMRFNREYFDRSLPKTAVQIIVFPYSKQTQEQLQESLHNNAGSYFPGLYLSELDLQSLGTLLSGLLDKKAN